MHIYTYIKIYTCTLVHSNIHMHIHINMLVCTHINMCTHKHMCIYININMCTYMNICVQGWGLEGVPVTTMASRVTICRRQEGILFNLSGWCWFKHQESDSEQFILGISKHSTLWWNFSWWLGTQLCIHNKLQSNLSQDQTLLHLYSL